MDLAWTPAGRADATRYGIAFTDVIAVIEAASSVQVHVGDAPGRLMYLGGRPDAVIVVTTDRVARNISAYAISEVRPATTRETQIWERKQS